MTRLGWVIISPGRELNVTKIILPRATTHDYDQLRNSDVLGVHEPLTDGRIIHQEFKDQLEQKVNGRYETVFIWKPNKYLLPYEKVGSIARLKTLMRRLLRDQKLFHTYEDIIRQSLRRFNIQKLTTKFFTCHTNQ